MARALPQGRSVRTGGSKWQQGWRSSGAGIDEGSESSLGVLRGARRLRGKQDGRMANGVAGAHG